MSNGDGAWPSWIAVALSALGGAAAAGLAFIRWVWNISDRVLGLEQKVGEHSVSEQIRADQHNNVMPEIMKAATIPLQELQDKVNDHGQKIAVLFDRVPHK